jgi:hypothetical protein
MNDAHGDGSQHGPSSVRAVADGRPLSFAGAGLALAARRLARTRQIQRLASALARADCCPCCLARSQRSRSAQAQLLPRRLREPVFRTAAVGRSCACGVCERPGAPRKRRCLLSNVSSAMAFECYLGAGRCQAATRRLRRPRRGAARGARPIGRTLRRSPGRAHRRRGELRRGRPAGFRGPASRVASLPAEEPASWRGRRARRARRCRSRR